MHGVVKMAQNVLQGRNGLSSPPPLGLVVYENYPVARVCHSESERAEMSVSDNFL